MNIKQAQRFYETLAMLIGNREGVKITVKVRPREEIQYGEQKNVEMENSLKSE